MLPQSSTHSAWSAKVIHIYSVIYILAYIVSKAGLPAQPFSGQMCPLICSSSLTKYINLTIPKSVLIDCLNNTYFVYNFNKFVPKHISYIQILLPKSNSIFNHRKEHVQGAINSAILFYINILWAGKLELFKAAFDNINIIKIIVEHEKLQQFALWNVNLFYKSKTFSIFWFCSLFSSFLMIFSWFFQLYLSKFYKKPQFRAYSNFLRSQETLYRKRREGGWGCGGGG